MAVFHLSVADSTEEILCVNLTVSAFSLENVQGCSVNGQCVRPYVPLLIGHLVADVTDKPAFVPLGTELCCFLWRGRHFFHLIRPLFIFSRKTVLSSILIAGDAVAIPEVDVNVVASMSRPAAADRTHPLRRWHLRIPATGNIVLIGDIVCGNNMALNVSPVSE